MLHGTQWLARVVCHRNFLNGASGTCMCRMTHAAFTAKMWSDICFRAHADWGWYDKTPEVSWCEVDEVSCTSTGPWDVTPGFLCRKIVRLKLMLACLYVLSFCLVSTLPWDSAFTLPASCPHVSHQAPHSMQKLPWNPSFLCFVSSHH